MSMNALQLIDWFSNKGDAYNSFYGAKCQSGYIGGRVVQSPTKGPRGTEWMLQCFFADEPELSSEELECVGLRRVLILDSMMTLMGLAEAGR